MSTTAVGTSGSSSRSGRTYVSGRRDRPGERTGTFRLGGDDLLIAQDVGGTTPAGRAGCHLHRTADSYGPFTAEQLIREALHPYADDPVIATKGA
ncbi:hypothetical protein [Streptomyces sp. DG1A-41]|uniref:hypothetical protein n=1 Tax=Streptomyces sp. DG1A-41 TaxID=3125779 RepID=UPI0030D1D5F1